MYIGDNQGLPMDPLAIIIVVLRVASSEFASSRATHLLPALSRSDLAVTEEELVLGGASTL